MTFPYDVTYEICFDGELGSVMSLDAHGHLNDADVEVFMATVTAEEFCDTLDFGFEVEHLWRHTRPFDGEFNEDEVGQRWEYHYESAEHEGSIAVTRFQVASPFSTAGAAPEVNLPEPVVAGIRQRICPQCGSGGARHSALRLRYDRSLHRLRLHLPGAPQP